MKEKIILWFVQGALKGGLRTQLIKFFLKQQTENIVRRLQMNKSWQTTVAGLISAIGLYLSNQKEPAWLGIVGQFLSVVGTAWLGMAARDHKVTSEDAGAK